jgi:hypothetical protein
LAHDIFVEESLSTASKDIDEESEWSLEIKVARLCLGLIRAFKIVGR